MLNETNRARLTTIKGMLTDFLEGAVGDRDCATELTRIYISELAEIMSRYKREPPSEDDKVSAVPNIDLYFRDRKMTIDLNWWWNRSNIYATLQAISDGNELEMLVGTKRNAQEQVEPIMKKRYSIPIKPEQLKGEYDF